MQQTQGSVTEKLHCTNFDKPQHHCPQADVGNSSYRYPNMAAMKMVKTDLPCLFPQHKVWDFFIFFN